MTTHTVTVTLVVDTSPFEREVKRMMRRLHLLSLTCATWDSFERAVNEIKRQTENPALCDALDRVRAVREGDGQ